MGDTLFADTELARRLETLCAAEMRVFAETSAVLDPQAGATWCSIAGGLAAFIGPGSPVNQAFALGFDGAVSAEDVTELDGFYRSRSTRAVVGVCPLAHPSLVKELGRAGFRPDGFENVLVGGVEGLDLAAPATDVEVREVVTEEDRELWALVAATGFSAPLPPLEQQLRLAHVVVSRPGARLFLASVGGKVAGTGELSTREGVAWLSADTTLPQFRRRGVQRAMQVRRIAIGAEEGCLLVVSEAMPGSASQRNMERLGLRVAYTRVDFVGRAHRR